LLFTFNETNMQRVYGPSNCSRKPYVKDAFHRRIIGMERCLNPEQRGTKAALHYFFPDVPSGGSVVVRLRLMDERREPSLAPRSSPSLLLAVDAIIENRKAEADEFYASLHKPGASADERHVQRQALAGLLWTKQSYLFDVSVWLDGDFPAIPPPASRQHIRNRHWRHLNSMRIMTVPDKWEYPWFAAWDLAFQCVALGLVDPGLRQGSTLGDLVRAVPASQRTDPGL